jgi:hypothetical protein
LTYIYVDEFGDMGLCGKRFFTIDYVCCENRYFLSKILRRYLNTIQQINRYPIELNELKFKLPKTRLKRIGYNDIWLEQFDTFMVTIRLDVLNIINKFSNNIFAVVVDKESIKEQTWSSEGFVTMFLLIYFKEIF